MAQLTLFPLQYQRQDAVPIDIDQVFTATSGRTAYLTSPRRYAGQIVSDLESEQGYMLSADKTTWKPLTSTFSTTGITLDVVLGNGNTTTKSAVVGDLTANRFIKSGGTATQVLAADGSIISGGTGIIISANTINADGLVPYIGATRDINIGINNYYASDGSSTTLQEPNQFRVNTSGRASYLAANGFGFVNQSTGDLIQITSPLPSTGNHVINVQDKDGTLALLGDITGLTGSFVTYTGWTGDVDGGTHTIMFEDITGNSTIINATLIQSYSPSNNYVAWLGNGQLTLGKSIINTGTFNPSALTGSRTYGLPNADGRLALTSDIPNISGYTPYVGANHYLDMGQYPIYATEIDITNSASSGSVPGGNVLIVANNDATNGSAALFTGGGSTYPNSTWYDGTGGVLLMTLGGTGNLTVRSGITANSFIKSGGTSSQFLKANGTIDSNTYLTSYTETDTLQSVTTRGAVTTNNIDIKSPGNFRLLDTGGSVQFTINLTTGNTLNILNSTGGTIFNIDQNGNVKATTFTEF